MNPYIPENKRREIQELLRQGHKIEAIKVFREVSGLGLKESKDAVEAMELTPGDLLERELRNPPSPGVTSRTTVSDLSSARYAVILELIRQDRKIEAIKLHRESTGLSLKDSKEAVDAMATSTPTPAPEGRLPRPHFDPFGEKKKGCFGMVAILCLAVFLTVIIIATR